MGCSVVSINFHYVVAVSLERLPTTSNSFSLFLNHPKCMCNCFGMLLITHLAIF